MATIKILLLETNKNFNNNPQDLINSINENEIHIIDVSRNPCEFEKILEEKSDDIVIFDIKSPISKHEPAIRSALKLNPNNKILLPIRFLKIKYIYKQIYKQILRRAHLVAFQKFQVMMKFLRNYLLFLKKVHFFQVQLNEKLIKITYH